MAEKNDKKKENPLVSIIIPVYNAEKYLNKCIDSVLNQNYFNIELLLIDDGSTDKSSQICDEYAKNNFQIKVIHQINQGQSSARNKGIEVSKGDFLCFVDNDDSLPDNSVIADMVNNIGVNDILIGDPKIFDKFDEKYIDSIARKYNKNLDGGGAFMRFIGTRSLYWNSMVKII